MTNQAPKTDRKPLPFAHDERVKVKCVDHQFGAASTKTDQIGIALQVVDGPHAGTILHYYGFFTDKTTEETIKAMSALGWNRADAPGCQSMYTKEALATIQHEEDEDKNTREKRTRMRVRWINPLGVRMDNAFDGAQLTRFGQQVNALGRRYGGGGGATAGGNGPQRLGGGDDRAPTDDRGRPPYRDDRDHRDHGPPPPQDEDAPPFDRGRRDRYDRR